MITQVMICILEEIILFQTLLKYTVIMINNLIQVIVVYDLVGVIIIINILILFLYMTDGLVVLLWLFAIPSCWDIEDVSREEGEVSPVGAASLARNWPPLATHNQHESGRRARSENRTKCNIYCDCAMLTCDNADDKRRWPCDN